MTIMPLHIHIMQTHLAISFSGLTVSVFAPLASLVDLLALRGLRLWRRAYLLPWLFLYAFAVSFVFANSFAGILHHGFRYGSLR